SAPTPMPGSGPSLRNVLAARPKLSGGSGSPASIEDMGQAELERFLDEQLADLTHLID
ncbi:hypothetical protein HV826_16895, partial [Myxococcus sp. AM010]|nr:hypothetical protein [Myxococcus sp. AM010]